MKGLYYYYDDIHFDKSIHRIRSYQCNIGDEHLQFLPLEHQLLEFVECNFQKSNVLVRRGSLDIYDCCFDNVSLATRDCRKVCLAFNKGEPSLNQLCISAHDVCISSKIKGSNLVRILSNNLKISDFSIFSWRSTLYSYYLNMKNCAFETTNELYFAYQNLNMEKILMISNTAQVSFANIKNSDFCCDNIITYHAPYRLTEQDILNERNKLLMHYYLF